MEIIYNNNTSHYHFEYFQWERLPGKSGIPVSRIQEGAKLVSILIIHCTGKSYPSFLHLGVKAKPEHI